MVRVRKITAALLPLALAIAVSPARTEGAANPVIFVTVDRKERGKVIGLEEQLQTTKTSKARVVAGKKTEPGTPDDWSVSFRWDDSPPEKESGENGDKTKPDPRPAVSASTKDAEKIRRLMLEAAGDSFGEEPGRDWDVAVLEGAETNRIEVVFPGPQTGISKARQFRVARRFVQRLADDRGMAPAQDGKFTASLFGTNVVGNYDAEGVGYGGSTLLDRAVDDTTLDMRILPLCPEDIRDGVLEGAAGVMFPGGSGKAIAKALRPEGVEKVREFVGRGGGYYGVCAGAYFANSGLKEYAALMPLKHHQPWRKGKGMLKVELTAEGKKLLGEEFAEFETRYNCGPVFTEMSGPPPDSPQKPVEVLANFASAVTDKQGVTHEVMIGTPAIIAGGWGKGRVVTVSPHPESHPKLSVLVARAIALSLGVAPATVTGSGGGDPVAAP